MKDFYENKSKSYKMSPVDIRIGKFCVVPSEKDTWKRAQIVTIIDTNKVEVFLCDYGSGCCVSNKHLYNILPEFCELSQQAFRGTLDYVTPIGDKTSDIFKELTCSKKLSACITQVETGVLLIWVVLLNLSDNKIVNEELVLKSGAKICPERSLYSNMKAFDKFHKRIEKNDQVNGLVGKFNQLNLLEALQKHRIAEEKRTKRLEREEANDSDSLESNTSTYNTDNDSRLEEIDFELENLTEFVYCERYYTDSQIHDLIYDEYDPCWECVEVRNRLKDHP